MNLSCIITTRNESPEILRSTILGLRETCPSAEIIVIDDASDAPIDPKTLPLDKYQRLPQRQGIADARAAGIEAAKNDWCVLLDAHMLFPHGWPEKLAAHFPADNEVISTTYVSCDAEYPSPLHPRSIIGGCKHNYFANIGDKLDFMFCTPLEPQRKDPKDKNSPFLHEYEVPCVMGAAYLIHADWWQHIGGSAGLKFYGGSDHLMSVKTWLCGGKVKVYGDWQIAHYCPANAVRDTPQEVLMANRLHIARCMLSDEQFHKLVNMFAAKRLPYLQAALNLMNQWHCHQIALAGRQRYTVKLDEWQKRFNIAPIEYWFDKFGVK